MGITAAALQYFVVLADESQFARAAARLHITSPSLSQQISRLERQVGSRLFERSPRGVTLTAAGDELLPLARESVRAHAAVADWARTDAPTMRALRVGIVASGAGSLTSAMLMSLVERLPEVSLELVRLSFFDAAPALRDGTVDVALTLAPFPAAPDLVSRPVLQEPRVLVIRGDDPLAARDTVRIDETNDLGFVVPSGAAGESLSWWLVDPRPDGTHPRVAAVADDVEGLMELCAAGIGVNIASRSVATHFGRPDLAYLDIVDIEPARVLVARTARPSHPATLTLERIAIETASSARPPVTSARGSGG